MTDPNSYEKDVVRFVFWPKLVEGRTVLGDFYIERRRYVREDDDCTGASVTLVYNVGRRLMPPRYKRKDKRCRPST